MSQEFNGTPIELRQVNNDYRMFGYNLLWLMTPENRRKGIQCPAFDLQRKYQAVYNQGSLPYTKEGRKIFVRLVKELRYAVFHFDRRFPIIKDTPEPAETTNIPSRLRRFVRWVFSRG